MGSPFDAVPAESVATLGIVQATVPEATSTELGLLMMYRRNDGQEADAMRIR